MGHQIKTHLDLCKYFNRWKTCNSSWIQKVIHFHKHRQQTLLFVFMYNPHGSFLTNKLTNTSEALEPRIKHEGCRVMCLITLKNLKQSVKTKLKFSPL
jgi:hypothetical protein